MSKIFALKGVHLPIFIFLLFSCHQLSAQTCTWEMAAPCETEKNESPTAFVNGKLYVFGGFYGGLEANYEVELYDPATNSWTFLEPMMHNVTHSPTIVVEDEIWILGGFEGASPGAATDVVQIYDTQNDSWSYGPALPHERAGFGAARLGRYIHIFSGLKPDRKTDVDEHYFYDLEDPDAGWQEAAPFPEPRNHLSAASLGGKIYAIGGQQGHDGPRDDKDYCHVYDPQTDSWSSIADLPSDRSHFEPGTFVLDGKIIITGGREASAFYNDILVYDPQDDQWSTLCHMDVNLMAPVARAWSDTLFVGMGGKNNASNAQSAARLTEISRDYPTNMDFYPATIEMSVMEAGPHEANTLLYILEGKTEYEIETAELPSWLSVENSGGNVTTDGSSIGLMIDMSGLAEGIYTYTINATAEGYDDAHLTIEIDNQCPDCAPAVICTAPTELVSTIKPTGTGFLLEWNGGADATLFQVKGRPLGQVAFAGVIASSPFKNVGGLQSGTGYEWKVRKQCEDGQISVFSPMDTFYTASVRIANQPETSSLTVSPKPANQTVRISISTQADEDGVLHIYDMKGSLVSQNTVSPSSNNDYIYLDISTLSSGIYSVTYQGSQSICSDLLIVE